VLAAADLFAFPSLFEGLGGSLIEAMALGLPIVASDLPAVREVLEQGNEGNATLVPPGMSEPLAEAIDDLLSDRSKAERHGGRSRRIFEERFTLDRSIDQMAGLYRAMVADRTGARSVVIAGRTQGTREELTR
jgi:glycosyltransferase involved in cell wall biosynthesis